MFLVGDDGKPSTGSNRKFFNYLAGFGIALIAFDYATGWLRSYLLRPRIRLPYALREWAADDEFYAEDEKYMTIQFKGAATRQHDKLPFSNEFRTRGSQYDPIIGTWGHDREMGK